MSALRYIVMSANKVDMVTYYDRIAYIVTTSAADAEPESGGVLLMMRDAIPALFDGELATAGEAFNVMCEHMTLKGVVGAPDSATKNFCAIVLTGFAEWFNDFMVADGFGKASFPGYDQLYGKNGAHLLRAITEYSYDNHHVAMCAFSNNDFYLSSCGGAGLLAFHWGDLVNANLCFDNHLPNILRSCFEMDQAPEAFGSVVVFGGMMPLLADLLGRNADMQETMSKAGFTYSGAEERSAAAPELCPFIRPKGLTGDPEGFLISIESAVWAARISHVLVSNRSVPKQELVSEMPTAEEVAGWATIGLSSFFHTLTMPLLTTGLVCERYGQYDLALSMVAAVLELSPNKGGNMQPSARIRANCVRGRVLAARGALVPPELAFEAAFEEAEGVECWLLAALSLKEQIKHCGGSKHGTVALQERLLTVIGKLSCDAAAVDALF